MFLGDNMLLDSFIAKIFYSFFVWFFSLYCSFAGGPVSPAKDAPIKPSSDEVQMSFALIADPQISNYLPDRQKYFTSACEDLKAETGLDALVMAGDIAENGLALEYQLVYEGLGGLDLQYIACEGNHDIRLRDYSQSTKRFNGWLNAMNGDSAVDTSTFHYSTAVKGVKFIILGSDRTEFEENYISPEQLKWLDEELASQKGSLTFVILHQPLKDTHGLPDVWNSPVDSAGSVGAQSDDLLAIFNKYDNVILITGHEHTGFGQYSYQKIGNFDSVNVPSFCVNNADGNYNEHGIGYITEVYEGKVLFRARDMCLGKWLPDYDIEITLK